MIASKPKGPSGSTSEEAAVLPQDVRASEGRLIRSIDRFMPKAMESASEDKRRQVRTAIGFLMASWLMSMTFSISNFRQGFFTLAYVELVAAAILTFSLFMIKRTGKIELFGNLGMLSGVGTVFIACWTGGGLQAPGVVMLLTAPAFSYLGYGRRSAVLWTWLSVGGAFAMLVAERMHWLPVPVQDPQKIETKRFIVVAFGVGFVYLAASLFSDIKDYALAMLQKRTEELREAHARIGELFHNMRQGVLAFDAEGRIEGSASAQASKIFGIQELTGENIGKLLFDGSDELGAEHENFVLWLEAAFSSTVDAWDELSQMAPNKIVRRMGSTFEQHLLLEFRPVANDNGEVRRVMLLVTDDTDRVRLERAAKARDDAHRKEVHELRKLVAGGAHLLLRFLETARNRLDEIQDALHLTVEAVPQDNDIAVAFQHVHTIRGEARAFQLSTLEAVCVQMEERLAPLRTLGGSQGASKPEFRAAMSTNVTRARQLLDEAEKHLVELSPIGPAVLDQITVRKSLLEEACSLAQQETPRGSALARALERLAARPFGESTGPLVDAVPLWAKRESKRVMLELEGRDTLVPRRVSRVLGGALTHLVRNAIAHGVETPSERERAGKPAEAVVRLTCAMAGDAAIIAVEDDGRGINENAVRSEAERLGISGNRSIEELLFEPGLSTCSDVTEIAGRGMGMSAVRRDLAAVGYQVRVISALGRGTRVELAPVAQPFSGRPGQKVA
jgi:PAS domain-containing protein/HPt (histidine-containing phosphotransfer) domain-containing protein